MGTNTYYYVGVYLAEGNQVKTENMYGFHNRSEILTTGGRSKMLYH